MEQILATKLYIPQPRPSLVRRPRLTAQLNAIWHHKLALIAAPAGFGKTTLISEWARDFTDTEEDLEVRAAWLSLDEGDNDPVRFLTYLITALRHAEGVEAAIGEGALNMLQSSQPPPTESILTALINDIVTVPGKLILFLDDYHAIQSPPVDEALTFLLENLPAQMHMVIASRDDPLLPLARLRARGQLIELRAADLRFTSAEAALFLNEVMSLGLSADDITALEARTEGWIAGLQLAAISMRGRQDLSGFIRSFSGSHRFVLDYLIEEVLEQQPADIQAFLLQTSVLDRLTGPLCDAITGRDESRATLEKLERANLFIISLDEERHWYRYHHLFADLLRQRLRQTAPEGITVLHNRASAWYGQNGFTDEAVEHALRAENFERAASLILACADTIWKRGEHIKLGRWLRTLPQDLLLSNPRLCIFGAWYLFARGQLETANGILRAAERSLETDTNLPDRERIRGRLAAIRALTESWWGDAPKIIRYAQQALDYLPKDDPWRGPAAIALGDAYDFQNDAAASYRARVEASEACKAAGDNFFLMIANLKLASTLRIQGKLQQVLEICRGQFQLAKESGLSRTNVAGWLFGMWGEVLAELNNLDEALIRAERGVELTEGGDLALFGASSLCLARVLLSMGDITGADRAIQKMENLAQEHDLPFFIEKPMQAWRALVWLAQDDIDSASRWMEERTDFEGKPILEHEEEFKVYARVLTAQGRLEESVALLQYMLEAAEKSGRNSSVIEVLLLQALNFEAEGDTDEALAALGRSLTLAEPGGFVRVFVDEGPRAARLLYEAISREIAADYARRLLAAFPIDQPEASPDVRTDQPDWVEPLSERELEVLQLIAEGLTNRDIATRLFLSLNTVKVHARNIYEKLAVHNRTQAVARAQALGILP